MDYDIPRILAVLLTATLLTVHCIMYFNIREVYFKLKNDGLTNSLVITELIIISIILILLIWPLIKLS